MAIFHFLKEQGVENKGVIVASLFPVKKVNGFSLKFKGKIRDKDGKLIDKEGEKLMDIKFGESMLIIPNSRKREGRRDPEYIVYAYPDQENKKK